MSLQLLIAPACFNCTYRETCQLILHMAYEFRCMYFSWCWVWVRREVADLSSIQSTSCLCSILSDHHNDSVRGPVFICRPCAIIDFPWKPHREFQPGKHILQVPKATDCRYFCKNTQSVFSSLWAALHCCFLPHITAEASSVHFAPLFFSSVYVVLCETTQVESGINKETLLHYYISFSHIWVIWFSWV